MLEAPLFNSDPTAYLPHGNSFLFVDRVLSLERGIRASGLKLVTHDPAGYPFVFLLESIAQLAGIAVSGKKEEGGFLAAVDHAEFPGSVCPGDWLSITVNIVKSFGRLHLCEGEVTMGGRRVASAVLTLGVGTP